MVIIWHPFLMWTQWWWWLCNSETTQPQYMIWLSFETIFWCKFNGDGDYVIWRLHSHNTWHGYHVTPFSIWIQMDTDYVIWRPHSHNKWYSYQLKPFVNVNSIVMMIMQFRIVAVQSLTIAIEFTLKNSFRW